MGRTILYHDLLVGSTGFVGGNLLVSHRFAAACHSSDIAAQYGTHPDLCVYAGVPAAMFLANADPAADLAVMRAARENLQKIDPRAVVLVSTIAVYADSRGKDETDEPDEAGLSAYGRNRLQLERWVRQDFPGALIVRLPALYGKGLKKNFLYDPLAENGFYKQNGAVDAAALRAFFAGNDFNALSFTDSRSRYQFYDLGRLWQDIAAARSAGLRLLHLCTPPVTAAQVYTAVTGKTGWCNALPGTPYDYDLHSRHAALLGGQGPYLCTVQQELDAVRRFVCEGEG